MPMETAGNHSPRWLMVFQKQVPTKPQDKEVQPPKLSKFGRMESMLLHSKSIHLNKPALQTIHVIRCQHSYTSAIMVYDDTKKNGKNVSASVRILMAIHVYNSTCVHTYASVFARTEKHISIMMKMMKNHPTSFSGVQLVTC